MDHSIILKALDASQKGLRYAFATIVETTDKGTPRKPGAKMIVYEDGSLFGTIGGGKNENDAKNECLTAIKNGKSNLIIYDCSGKDESTVCGGKVKVFIEPVAAQKHLIVCGAGHIAQPLSIIGKMLNYKVTVIDDRKEFANRERFAHVDNILVGNHVKKLSTIKKDANTNILIATHDHKYDFECLRSVVESEVEYLGVIASKTKRIKFFSKLKDLGVSQKLIRKIRAPAGIDIGAQTPEEIAVAIAAELVSINNKFSLGTDKFKDKIKRETL